jgi:hypothetical protein
MVCHRKVVRIRAETLDSNKRVAERPTADLPLTSDGRVRTFQGSPCRFGRSGSSTMPVFRRTSLVDRQPADRPGGESRRGPTSTPLTASSDLVLPWAVS